MPTPNVWHTTLNFTLLIDVSATLSPVEVKQGFSRRAIEQLGFLKDVNALVALSGERDPPIRYIEANTYKRRL